MSCANQFMFLYVLCLSMLKTFTQPAPGSNQSLYTLLLLLFKTKNLTNGVELVAVLDGDFSKGLQMYFEGNSIISYNDKL